MFRNARAWTMRRMARDDSEGDESVGADVANEGDDSEGDDVANDDDDDDTPSTQERRLLGRPTGSTEIKRRLLSEFSTQGAADSAGKALVCTDVKRVNGDSYLYFGACAVHSGCEVRTR